jgi:hypothetical protein
MESNGVNRGFSTFKKAKNIGPIKVEKHKQSGKHKDPITANKKFFKANPTLIEYARHNALPNPNPEEDKKKVEESPKRKEKVHLTSLGKKS